VPASSRFFGPQRDSVFSGAHRNLQLSRSGGLVVKRYGGILAVALFLGLSALAQAPQGSGWVPLFNGKDLTGWKNNGDEKWVVEQGTILCESTANKYGYLTTEKTYKDFTLRLKFKGEAAGNSGVFLHSKILGIDPQHGPDIEGMQVEVDPNVGKHTGGLYESGGRGWVAQPTTEGEQALTQLNGTKIVDFTDPAPKFTDGVIGLQIHTGGGVKVRWKDIYLKVE
jgi:Domain of Unknown Function (DUF1080)